MTEDFVSFQLASYNPIVSTWLGTAALRANIERELCREIEAWTAESAATIRFFTSKPIPGATPADYALREIFLHCGCVVIAQIHFYGQDITKPFVRVHAQSRAMTAAEIIEAARELGERFRVFTPQRVLFHSPQGGVDLNTLPGAEGDQRVFAGRIAELIALPRQKSDMQFDLQPGDPREYYDEYSAMYDAFWAARPALHGRVLREPIESLIECHETGRCLHARVDGRLAAVVASCPSNFEGLDGWLVREEILAPTLWGRGLGVVLQRGLIDSLAGVENAILFGTIDEANVASMRTATRCGRVDIAGWTFVPV
jgi:hypothetical protein